MDLSTYLIYGVPALALVIALVKLAQETGLPSKYAPLTSVGIGIIVGITIAVTNSQPILQGVILGICFGLSSSGIYDLGKKSSDTTTVINGLSENIKELINNFINHEDTVISVNSTNIKSINKEEIVQNIMDGLKKIEK